MKTTPSLIAIKPSQVDVRQNFNTRSNHGDLRQLKASIKEKGYDPAFPIIVAESATSGRYILGAQGHRRLGASLLLEKEGELKDGTIYAVLEEEGITETDRNLDIIRLNTGEPLSRLAEAKVMVRALANDKDLSNRELARRLGYSGTHVDNSVLLTLTTQQTQDWIEQGKIAATLVIDLMKENKKDAEKVEEVVEALIKKATEGGKEKAKKEKKPKDEPAAETEEEKAAREEEERQAKEEKAALKARNKVLADTEKRVNKFAGDVREAQVKVKASEKSDDFDKALNKVLVLTGSFLQGTILDTDMELAEKGDTTKLSDIWTAVRALNKAANEMTKTAVDAVKAEKDAEIATMKEEAKKKAQAIKDAVKK